MTTRLVILLVFFAVGSFFISFSLYKDLHSPSVGLSASHLSELVASEQMRKAEEAHKLSGGQAGHGEVTADEEEVIEEKVLPEVVLDTPQLVRGNEVYLKIGKCNICHGNNGEGKKSQLAPMIGGQHEWYILSQLQNMKLKKRVNVKMDPYLRPLSDQDIKDVSLYISKMTPY